VIEHKSREIERSVEREQSKQTWLRFEDITKRDARERKRVKKWMSTDVALDRFIAMQRAPGWLCARQMLRHAAL